jgi:uncharacterized protein
MNNIGTINDFLGASKIALVGISRNEKKFGNYAYKDLKSKGLNIVPIHSEMSSYDGDTCYKSIGDAEGITAVISVVNKSKTADVLREAKAAGINNVWIQQGTDTPEAISFAEENKMDVVKGECILMFTSGDKFPHNFHRFFVKLFGAYPK